MTPEFKILLAQVTEQAQKTLDLQQSYFRYRDRNLLIAAKNSEKQLQQTLNQAKQYIIDSQNSPEYD